MNNTQRVQMIGLRRTAGRRLGLLGLFALASVMLGGCGFHLQGGSPLPDGIDTMYVSYSNDYRVGDPPLVETLRQRLRERHILGDIGAPARLAIEEIDNRQRIVSVSPIDGRVAEYELTSVVLFDYDVNGANQLENETLKVSRNYSFDDTERLSAEQEQSELLTSMHEELANLILLRVATANDKLGH
jgi:LPS-assembly lipoprotein